MMAVIQRWKDRGLTPSRVTPAEDTDFAAGRARELSGALQARLRSLNAADFGDLLLYMTELMREQPDVLTQYHRMFRYILVDEYQDTNLVQSPLRSNCSFAGAEEHLLCRRRRSNRSIRGAARRWRTSCALSMIFPAGKYIRLEENYRSTAPILAAASGLIAHNDGRLGKTLRPGRQDASGECVTVVALGTPTRRRTWWGTASSGFAATVNR